MDPFGLKWEIFTNSRSHDEEEENEDNDEDDDSSEKVEEDAAERQSTRLVLYRWDCGYSSIFPPKHGWKTIEGPCDIKRLSYQFSDRPC
jgi:TATA-binding protein-associated factor Taf7